MMHTAANRSLAIASLLSALALPVASSAQQPPTAPVADDSQPDDIIVRGLRDRRKLPTQVAPPATVSGPKNRVRYEIAERTADCAARARVAPLSRLSAVVDGEFNSPRQAAAQDRLRRAYISCGEGYGALLLTTPDAPPMTLGVDSGGVLEGGVTGVDPSPLGHSIYDRGAFTIAAMRHFAPDLTLTRKETGDPAVQERFNLREAPRNRFRLPVDKRYFEVAVCMVRLQPGLSVQLALGSGEAQQSDLQAEIINRARACVGGAKRVTVDATQFRLYIADAVYRWAVAARNVATLIPRKGQMVSRSVTTTP